MTNRADLLAGSDPPSSPLRLPGGYRQPAADAPLLAWSWADERLRRAPGYWLATTTPGGRPHVTPVWGVWVERALYFDGFRTARWARNLAANPVASVHLESTADVVILDGIVTNAATDPDLADRIVQAWDVKYGRLRPDPAGRGIYCFRPRVARAWSSFPEDATRWSFAGAE